MKKGEIYEGRVIRVDYPDRAVAITAEGERAIVKYALPGQTIRFRVTKNRKSHTEGALVEVLEPSPLEEPEQTCGHFGSCGGCICQSLPYEEQLRMKEGQIRRLLDSTGERYLFEGIEPSPVTQGYRNKMELTFGDEYRDGPLALGMHRRGSFYDIVSVPDCRIMHEDMKRVAACVLEHFRESGVPYYHRMRHTGLLRHLLLRRSAASGEVMAALVTASEGMSRDELSERLSLKRLTDRLAALPLKGSLAGFLHMKNDSVADAVQSEETTVLFGKASITERLLGLSFEITPFSFFQTNSAGAEVLYRTVREYIGETKGRLVFDLYSGTGTIAQILAPVAKQAVGVEIVGEAVEAARRNAAANGLSNCRFLEGDVLKVLDELEERPDLIVLDPPRDGVHPKALPKILRYQVPRIVYVSCKPTSLVRDWEIFREMGYRMVKARAVDLFPGTGGIETVCQLSKPDIG